MKCVSRQGLWFMLLVLVGTCHSSPAFAAALKAGIARIDLTPPLEMNCSLGGYGERMSKPAEGIHDRIWAKALVLSDGERKFAIVTADMLGFPFPFKEELVAQLNAEEWKSEQIMLLPSHSHTSIEMNAIHSGNTFEIPQIGIYNKAVHEFTLANFKTVLEAAARQLRENPVEVQIGTSTTQIEGWNNNRRQEDFTDNDLTITRVDTLDGKPLAVLVNFTAHPTFMSAAQMLFSAGWPGHLQRTMETFIGGDVMVMYYNGAQGDQSPRARPGSGESRWEKSERYGMELGRIGFEQWKQTETSRDVVFRYRTEHFELPPADWHPDFMQTGGKEYGLSVILLRKMIPRLFAEESHCTTVQIGQLAIIGVPGEMVAGMGAEIKQAAGGKLGVKSPTIGGLADVWISYILTEEAWRAGGYEASVSFYGPQLGPVVKNAAEASFPD